MQAIETGQLRELQYVELAGISGGTTIISDGSLARDIGRTVGAAVGAFMRIGEAFYRSGGLTGGNPWLGRR